MKSKINHISHFLAFLFMIAAVASFFMKYLVYPYHTNGFNLAGEIFGALNVRLGGIFVGAALTALGFVFAWVSLILHHWLGLRFCGVGVGVCSAGGAVAMIIFAVRLAARKTPSWFPNAGEPFVLGYGIYVCIVALICAFICAVIGLVTYRPKDIDEVAEQGNNPQSINVLNV